MNTASARALADRWQGLSDEALIEAVLADAPTGKASVVTSFGIESAVLLDMVARVDPATSIIFIDTGQLFAETLIYRDQLIDRLGLTKVKTIKALAERVAKADPDKELHQTDSDACCRVRKVEPYARALSSIDIEITGRKRYQSDTRSTLNTVERIGDRIKVNPLAQWSAVDIDAAFDQRGLPRHPLFFDGYDSVGCTVCSRRRRADETSRAGRWENSEKTECGIHFAFDGGVVKVTPDNQDQHYSYDSEKEAAQ